MSTPAIADHSAEAGPAKSGGKKRLLLLAVPVALAAIGAGLWFGGILPPLLGMGAKPKGGEEHAAEGATPAGGKTAEAAKPPTFLEMPELIANLNAGPRRTAFVKIKPRLELVRAEDEVAVKAAMPRLLDLFQTYLREIRPEELRGSIGSYRLREELLARANIAVAPVHVVDVLFPEMLVQ